MSQTFQGVDLSGSPVFSVTSFWAGAFDEYYVMVLVIDAADCKFKQMTKNLVSLSVKKFLSRFQRKVLYRILQNRFLKI